MKYAVIIDGGYCIFRMNNFLSYFTLLLNEYVFIHSFNISNDNVQCKQC